MIKIFQTKRELMRLKMLFLIISIILLYNINQNALINELNQIFKNE